VALRRSVLMPVAGSNSKSFSNTMPQTNPPICAHQAMPPADPTARLAEYEGDYYSEEIDATYRVAIKDGKLALMRKKNSPLTLQPAFRDGFSTLSILGNIRFTRDAQSRINGFTLSAGRIRSFRFVKK